MADGSIRIDVGLNTSKADKDLARLKEKIARTSASLTKDSARKDAVGKEFAEVGARLDEATAKVRALKKEVRNSKGNEKELLKLEIAEAVEEQRILTTETNRAAREYETLSNRIKEGETNLAAMTSEAGQMEQAIAEARIAEQNNEKMEQAREGVRNLAVSVADTLNDALTKANQGIKTIVVGLGSALVGGLRKVGSVAASAGRAIIGFGKNILGLNKNTAQLGQGFKMGLGTILKYGLGIRSMFVLFRRLRAAVKDAITDFAKKDSETKATVDGLKASLATLKASWGAAFAPILNAVAPVINTLINLCTRAANAVAALFAALTGKSTFKTAATDAQALADATSAAGGAAKEAKKQLMGFDELNILSGDNSGGGSGGSATTYEENELPDWAAQIKELFLSGQWEEIAALAADRLNALVKDIPWDSIGKQIGYYLNAAFTIGAKLLTGFDWYELGNGIGTLISNAISSVDWRNLGTLLVGKIWALGNALAGLMNSIDWEAAANGFFDLLSGAIFGVDWVLLAKRLVFGLSKIFEGVGTSLASKDWTKIGQELTTLISRFFTEINWSDLANDVVGFLTNLFDAATNLLKAGGDYSKIGAKLWIWFRDAIAAINWDALATSAFTLLGTAFGAAVSVIGQFVKNAITSIFDYFSLYVDGGEDGEIDWQDIAYGILEGIAKGFVDIAKWIYTNIAKPFVEGIKSVFGIHSPSTLMEPFGENIFKGLLQGIIDAVAGIGSWINENIWVPFKEGITAIFGESQANAHVAGFGVNIVEGLKNGILRGLLGLGTWIYEAIWTPVCTGLNDIMAEISTWWQGVIDFFSGASEQINQAMGSTTHISSSGNTHGGSGGSYGWHARGGIYDRPTIVGVGEAGKEAIIPLENHTEWITLVAAGLIERMSEAKFANQLAAAFASAPMPAIVGGSIIPPKATYGGAGAEWNNSISNKLDTLASQISELARQPIQVSSKMYLDRREIGRSVTEYQRDEQRARGR